MVVGIRPRSIFTLHRRCIKSAITITAIEAIETINVVESVILMLMRCQSMSSMQLSVVNAAGRSVDRKNTQANSTKWKVMVTFINRLIAGCLVRCMALAIRPRSPLVRTEKAMYTPNSAPQATKFQLAPCHRPASAIVAKTAAV